MLSNLIQGQEGRIIINIPWEDTVIDIPLDLNESKEAIIYKVIREMQREITILQKQVILLKEERNHFIIYKFEKISDEMAEHKMVSYLKEMKNKINEVTIFEISQTLKLPADQVERIIEKLEQEGKVKWVEK